MSALIAEGLGAPLSGQDADVLTFFEVSLDLLVIRGLDGTIQRVSPACHATLGYRPEALCGRSVLELVHPDDRAETSARMTEVDTRPADQPVETIRNRYLHCEGHYVWLEWRAYRSGDRIYAVGRDVTEKLASENDLRKAKAEAGLANQAKSDFLANMSHEIRTPLHGIIGLVDALSVTELTSHQAEMVEMIRKSGQNLTQLLSDILDMSMAETGRMSMENQAFDLEACLAEVISIYQTLVELKGLQFRVERPDNLTGFFLGDEGRLKQVLNNLLANAIKFTNQGQICLRFHLAEGVGEPTLLSFEVEDTGIGFDAEVASSLFQRFNQADATISRRFGGSGLGLSICQSIVHMMGGQISARSAPGVGSSFRVELPVPRDTPSPITISASTPSWPDRPLNVLVADDHPINRKLIQLLLADLPIEVTMVTNGCEAVEAFQTCRYDLILMDMQMPVMDGLRATHAIRAYEASHPYMPRTPIFMVTANVMEKHRVKSIKAGADMHLAKPITAKDLRNALNQVLDQPERVRMSSTEIKNYPSGGE